MQSWCANHWWFKHWCNLLGRNSLVQGVLISKCEVQRWPKISHPKAFSAAPNGRDIQKIWRHNVNLNVIVLCLMEGIFTKCDGYLIQRTFLVPPRGAGVIFSRGEREWNRKISIAGVTWHLDAQPNGMLRIFARCVCRRMGSEIGRDQLLHRHCLMAS